MTKERKTVPYLAVIAVLAVVAAGVGVYLQYYKPSQRDILSGPQPPVAENMQPTLPTTPLSELPEPDQSRFADALRDAVATVKPDYHVDVERLYTYTGGWDAVRKLTGQYLGNEFDYEMYADTQTQVDGESVDDVLWRPAGWLRRQFDDRVVAAVGIRAEVEPGVWATLLGYFAVRPGAG